MKIGEFIYISAQKVQFHMGFFSFYSWKDMMLFFEQNIKSNYLGIQWDMDVVLVVRKNNEVAHDEKASEVMI